MSDNVHGDNSQNNIPQNPEINNRFDVAQRENDQMGNFVEAYPIPHIPDPVPNNNIELEMNLLGLGLEPQQQLDDQGNQMGGVAVAEPEPIVENPQPLQAAEDHQLPDPAFDPVVRGISPAEAQAMDRIMSMSFDLYDSVIIDNAACVMMELLKMARQKQLHPLGDQRSNVSDDSESELQSSFAFYDPNNVKTPPVQPERYAVPLHTEISREVAVIGMNRIGVIELLMDPILLSTHFPDIVASASVIREIMPGTVDYNGTLQVMRIEYHMPSPLASTRGGYFLRYSQKVSEDTWAVVDQSLENLFGFAGMTYQRNWSGCTILELPDAQTKVTWLENVEVNNSLHHNMLQGIVGLEFGAKRWISAFLRQWDWMKSPALRCGFKGKSATSEGVRDILILANKMMKMFFANASPSPNNNNWVPIIGREEVRVAMKPYPGNVEADDDRSTLVIATTTPIPVFQKELFQFLSDPRSLEKWDLRTMKHMVQEKLRINIGDDKGTGDFVSVLQFETEGGDATLTYLQRSYTDSTISFTVSAPVDVPTMKMLLNGTGDPNQVEFLPSGFVVFPDSCSMNGEDINGGSLLTAVFQIIDRAPHDGLLPPNSAAMARRFLEGTLSLIKDAVVRGE